MQRRIDILNQNDKKLARWLDEYGDYLFAYAMKKVQDRDVAYDLVQESFMGALRANYKGDSSLRTWLVGILKHKVIDDIRKQIRERELRYELEHDPGSRYFSDNGSWAESQSCLHLSPERQVQNGQLQQDLMACISQLSDQQRTTFILREIHGQSTHDICQEHGLSSSKLHVIMHRARLALCKCLNGLGYTGSAI